jgi:hypothetical protein
MTSVEDELLIPALWSRKRPAVMGSAGRRPSSNRAAQDGDQPNGSGATRQEDLAAAPQRRAGGPFHPTRFLDLLAKELTESAAKSEASVIVRDVLQGLRDRQRDEGRSV